MNPKLRIASVALAAATVCSPVFAQAKPERGPLDRTEILGRLALGYPPSYVAQLVAQRGLRFSLTADFLYRVKLAGGDGILVEKLSAADASTSSAAVTGDSASTDHLAKCAELVFTGADDSAKAECKSAISENPSSPWPLVVASNTLELDLPLLRRGRDQQKNSERLELLQQAADLDPTLPPVRFLRDNRPGMHVELDDEVEMDEQQYLELLNESVDTAVGLSNFDQVLVEDKAPPASGVNKDEPPPEEFLRAVQENPDLAINHASLARWYQMQRNLGKATEEWREILRLEPDNPFAHSHLGATLLSLHKSEAGLAEFREAARIVPFGDCEHLALAAALERLGRTSDAFDELQSMIELRPADAQLSGALVQLELKHDDRKSAINELRRSLKVSVAAAASEADAIDSRRWDENLLAELLRQDRQFDAAAEQYLYLLRFRPDDSSVHNDYGNLLMDRHNCDAAIAEYYEAVRLNPSDAAPHINVGLCREQEKDFDGAIAEFREALKLYPEDTEARVFLGGALGQKGDIRAAKKEFQQALDENPQDANMRMNIGFQMMMFKGEADAIPQLKAALALQSDSPAAENNLAWIYCTAEDHKLRNPGEALVLARRAVAATSDSPNPAFLDTLAEAQSLNDQAREAVASETQALALDPDNPEYKSRLEQFRSAATAVASAK
jgi:tetratricopeptide (TPR) repeat protein